MWPCTRFGMGGCTTPRMGRCAWRRWGPCPPPRRGPRAARSRGIAHRIRWPSSADGGGQRLEDLVGVVREAGDTPRGIELIEAPHRPVPVGHTRQLLPVEGLLHTLGAQLIHEHGVQPVAGAGMLLAERM